jgi:hypothetical protein
MLLVVMMFAFLVMVVILFLMMFIKQTSICREHTLTTFTFMAYCTTSSKSIAQMLTIFIFAATTLLMLGRIATITVFMM